MAPISTLFFDVNETLLDIRIIDDLFNKYCHQSLAGEWFNQLILFAFETTISKKYIPFTELTKAALEVVKNKNKIKLSNAEEKDILSSYLRFPAHKDVIPSLKILKDKGIRCIALTNSPLVAVEAQLKNADIIQYFELVLSADTVKKLKPAAEVYRYATEAAETSESESLLIAAHNWDTTGAALAGWQTALLLRSGVVPNPLAPPNTFLGNDLLSLTKKIIPKCSN